MNITKITSLRKQTSTCAVMCAVLFLALEPHAQENPVANTLARQQQSMDITKNPDTHFQLVIPRRAPSSHPTPHIEPTPNRGHTADTELSAASAAPVPHNNRIAAAPPPPPSQTEAPSSTDQNQSWHEKGLASWYAGRFQGRTTANGERFDTNKLTAAHKTLPFNSIVEVYNPTTQQSVLVRINDRGPFVEGRVIDLSRAAANALEITTSGISPVYLRVVRRGVSDENRLHLIQIGSFSRHQNALDLMQDLRIEGFNPVIESQNDTLFRVIIPSIPATQISHYQTALATKGYSNVLVRVE